MISLTNQVFHIHIPVPLIEPAGENAVVSLFGSASNHLIENITAGSAPCFWDLTRNIRGRLYPDQFIGLRKGRRVPALAKLID